MDPKNSRPACPACGHAVPLADIRRHFTRGGALRCPSCGRDLEISIAALLVTMVVFLLAVLPLGLLPLGWSTVPALLLMLWMAYYGYGWVVARLSRWFAPTLKQPVRLGAQGLLLLILGSIGAAVALAWWLHGL